MPQENMQKENLLIKAILRCLRTIHDKEIVRSTLDGLQNLIEMAETQGCLEAPSSELEDTESMLDQLLQNQVYKSLDVCLQRVATFIEGQDNKEIYDAISEKATKIRKIVEEMEEKQTQDIGPCDGGLPEPKETSEQQRFQI